ncbi:MAG: GNAT family N-acetyltransferase [Pseudomonadota bacterium]
MTAEDVPAARAILNEIIGIGGTTAFEEPFDDARFVGSFLGSDLIACHVAEDETGRVLGFQWIGRNPDLPPKCADIATFAARNPARPGVGRALFQATQAAARGLGFGQINATILADNQPGLGYYSKMGFSDHAVHAGVAQRNGAPVDRVSKRFDLSRGEAS